MQDDAAAERVRRPDGVELAVRRWEAKPGGTPAWARALLVHGLADHSGRWALVGDRFAGLGLETHAFDMRGFGESGGQRAYVERWSDLHDDLADRIAVLRAAEPALPLLLYAHSLGGLVALGYVLDGRPLPDLLVLSAPAIDATLPRWKRIASAALARIVPGLEIPNGLDPSWLSHDPVVAARYVSDPRCQHRSTVRFGAAGFAEQRRLRTAIAGLRSLPLPTLVVHGGEDPIVPPAISEAFERLGGVTRRVYPGLRHEIHNEADGARIAIDVVDWARAAVSYNPVDN